jgi:hypothetical protein
MPTVLIINPSSAVALIVHLLTSSLMTRVTPLAEQTPRGRCDQAWVAVYFLIIMQRVMRRTRSGGLEEISHCQAETQRHLPVMC